MTAETLTLTAAAAAAAAALARPLGYTIRREPEAGEIVAYAKGTGKNAPHAYFTDCPVDALATVCAMAQNTDSVSDSDLPAYLDALKAAREACGVPMTRAERREAGHAAELAADSSENPAERAAHYDRAAELFETLGGFHYPGRARHLRDAACKSRAVAEYLAVTPRDLGETVESVCDLLGTALANSGDRPARINPALEPDDLAQTIAAAVDCLKTHVT